jgi:hypothetical protein
VSHFKKFFSVALIAGAFFNACGLCQADDILSPEPPSLQLMAKRHKASANAASGNCPESALVSTNG